MNRRQLICIVATVAVFSLVAGWLLSAYFSGTLGGDGNFSAQYSELYNRIMTEYYKETDGEALKTAALKGMVELLEDPYSSYMTAEEYAAYMDSSSGVYAGIGVEVTTSEDGLVLVKKVYKNSPGDRAGLQVEDVIYGANDIFFEAGMTLEEMTSHIKGDEGTEVVMYVRRGQEELTFTAKRERIIREYVEYRMQEDGIGYLRLEGFSGNCVSEFKEAVEALQAQGAQALVLDLRENPGGFVDDCVAIADYLLPEGTIVYTETRTGQKTVYTSSASAVEMPIALLINGNTASASEILAGALQDYGTAVVIGEQSYGKGIVQRMYPMATSGGAVKLTISSYFTPKGRSIHGTGITPDIEVKLETAADEQLQQAVAEMRKKVK